MSAWTSLAPFCGPGLNRRPMLSRVTRALTRPTSAWHDWRWGLLAVAVSLFPVSNVFTLSRIFYVRDLTLAFRPRFLFLRQCFASSTWPLWDPYPANGQTPISDALLSVVSLSLSGHPAAAPRGDCVQHLGGASGGRSQRRAFLYLRRHVVAPAAAFGAIVFALAGPTSRRRTFQICRGRLSACRTCCGHSTGWPSVAAPAMRPSLR
jgi:hypothetical protein